MVAKRITLVQNLTYTIAMSGKIRGYFLFKLITILNKTLKIKIINNSGLDLSQPQGYIFALWHSNSFTPLSNYQNKNLAIFISKNLKGKILGYAAQRLGFDTIETSQEDPRSIVILKQKIVNGQNCVMAVDGPSGPGFLVKDGCKYLTEKTKTPTIPLSVNYKNYLPCFWRWDKYKIPLPFSQVTITFNKPLYEDSDWSVFKTLLS